MAFRKKVVNDYQPPCFYGGFSERKFMPFNDGRPVSVVSTKDVSVLEINDSSLPVMSLNDVKASGKYIDGVVSFAPNDPTNYNEVQSVVGDFVDRVISQSNAFTTSKESFVVPDDSVD